MPENIFSGPKLYSPMHFPSFQAKQKTSYLQFFKKQLQQHPPLMNQLS